LDSFGQKLRFIILSNILTSFAFMTALRMETSSAFCTLITLLPKSASVTNDLKGKDKEHTGVVCEEKENMPTTLGLLLSFH